MKSVSKQEFLGDLQRVYNLLEHAPFVKEYQEHGKYHWKLVYKFFKSYTNACREAGFEPRFTKKPSPKNKDELFNDLILVKQNLGKIPTYTEYLEHGRFSVVTVRTYFGSFYKAKLLLGFNPCESTWDINNVKLEDGHWLSGFVEGDGRFGITVRKFSIDFVFSVSQRADRINTIREVARILEVPPNRITFNKANGPNKEKQYLPTATLDIKDLPTLALQICPLFDRFSLRGKKREDFRIFKAAVTLHWKKYTKDGKRHFTTQEKDILRKLALLSHLIKQPHVTLNNIKSKMP